MRGCSHPRFLSVSFIRVLSVYSVVDNQLTTRHPELTEKERRPRVASRQTNDETHKKKKKQARVQEFVTFIYNLSSRF